MAIMYRDNDTGDLHETPNGLEDYDEVFACDICGSFSTWAECVVTDGHDYWRLCPDCQKIAVINLFEIGANNLGDTEEAWVDSVLNGGCWADLKKLYQEARE